MIFSQLKQSDVVITVIIPECDDAKVYQSRPDNKMYICFKHMVSLLNLTGLIHAERKI
jgi:hypothetical protein